MTNSRKKAFVTAFVPKFGTVTTDQQLFMLFLALQLLGHIQWSWMAICSPLLLTCFLYLVQVFTAVRTLSSGNDFPTVKQDSRFGLAWLTTLMLIAFKLSGIVGFSWWIVFSPTLIGLGIVFVLAVIAWLILAGAE